MARRGGFPGMMGGGNMQQLARQAQMLQQQISQLQENLDKREFEATAGGGMVRAKVNGEREILELEIKPEAVDPNDVEMLQDMIVAALNEALKNVMIYLYFDVMQIVNVKQEVGFDFEQGSGKMNGLDMDGDGLLGRDENGGLILQNAYGQDARLLPDWAYDLDFKQGWWVSLDGSLINEEGKKLVGANEDGSYTLEG